MKVTKESLDVVKEVREVLSLDNWAYGYSSTTDGEKLCVGEHIFRRDPNAYTDILTFSWRKYNKSIVTINDDSEGEDIAYDNVVRLLDEFIDEAEVLV
jgi:hypothetical protein